MSEEKKGELYLFGSTITWAAFPVVAKIALATVPLFIVIAWTTGFSCLFFLSISMYRKKLRELRQPQLWRYLLFVALFLGVLFYFFYFTGLSYSTPGNVAILALFEVFTSFIVFNLWQKEPFRLEYKIGTLCMLVGASLVLFNNASGFQIGDILIILATCIAPFGNIFQKKARVIASSETILFVRTLIATPVLFVLAYIFEGRIYDASIQTHIFSLLLIGTFFLGLSKLFWIESIHRMSVTKAAALSSFGPFLTLVFAWTLLSDIPTIVQLISLPVFIFGVLLLTNNIKLKKHASL